MTSGPEFAEVEKPLIDQLVGMGWVHTEGDLEDPLITQRDSFREVLLPDDLRAALRRINRDPSGRPWLDDARITQAVNALERLGAVKLTEANQKASDLLLRGTVVDGVEGWDQGRGRTVHFIDWDHPENNTFRVVNQFQVACPAGQTDKHIRPDIVLFVNGIPLVVVEAKSPTVAAPLEAAIDQLQRYSNRRREAGLVEMNEGSERLFHTSQFLVATCGEEARVGTFSSQAVHFLEWKDTSPVPMAEVATELGKPGGTLTSQEKLVAGMLRPAHLLDIVRHFTLFTESGGRTVKIVGRYQQFRAVQLAVGRLRNGRTRAQDGEHDRRGGIVWHTQGSGKSLTMVFLVRKMRSDPALRRFKVVVVTDREDLQRQLKETAVLTGEPVRVARSIRELKTNLSQKGAGLEFATIQKYRPEEAEPRAWEPGNGADLGELRVAEAVQAYGSGPEEVLAVLNDSEEILVLVDEAHRSHASALHGNLLRALPNCARIGFTGTPILMGDRKATHEIFGEFIDRYTIKQSEEDGATVPILYEGRTAEGAVQGGTRLDKLFEDMFAAESSPEQLEAIQRKYATKGSVLEASAMIEAKAADMLRHYVDNILPNGFKAQVVAVSRLAAIRYRGAFEAARAELVEKIERLDPALLARPAEERETLDEETAFLLRAHRYLNLIRAIEFAPVISGAQNDDPAWAEWSDGAKVAARIARFKKPLIDEADPGRADPLAFLIVKSMLLTGFDAPVEQALYLDRGIREAELLQAIARVNRRCGEKKTAGLVIDYYGVGAHLKEALKVYSDEDVEGCLRSLADDVPKLRDRHRRVLDIFADRGAGLAGPFSSWERRELVRRFARWRHPAIPDPGRAVTLGDEAAAEEVVRLLERVLLLPTPGVAPDPYARLHDKTVSAVRRLLSPGGLSTSELADETDKLVLQLEPFLYKILSIVEPETYAALASKKRGLDVALIALRDSGHSPYTLRLSREEFERREGWEGRSSLENAVHDVVPARLDVAHRSVSPEPRLWESAVAFLLGVVATSRAALRALPEPEQQARRDQEACVELLRDEKLRTEFQQALKQFLASLDTVLPRPEALPYVSDAKVLALIQAKARNRYRAGLPLIGREVGEKVRKLIDDHVVSNGIDPSIPPIAITDAHFQEHVEQHVSPRARASEMEHALRHHIRRHYDEDPTRFARLSERLEEILKELEDRWDEQVAALQDLVEEAKAGQKPDESGLDPETHLPFFSLLRREVHGDAELEEGELERLRRQTIELVDHVQQEVALVGFWRNAHAQDTLRGWIVQFLDAEDLVPFPRLEGLAQRFVELARANHHRLVG